jgi:hypothetical protein
MGNVEGVECGVWSVERLAYARQGYSHKLQYDKSKYISAIVWPSTSGADVSDLSIMACNYTEAIKKRPKSLQILKAS